MKKPAIPTFIAAYPSPDNSKIYKVVFFIIIASLLVWALIKLYKLNRVENESE